MKSFRRNPRADAAIDSDDRRGRQRRAWVLLTVTALALVAVWILLFSSTEEEAKAATPGDEKLFYEGLLLVAQDMTSGSIRFEDLARIALDCLPPSHEADQEQPGITTYMLRPSPDVSGSLHIYESRAWQGHEAAGELQQFTFHLTASSREPLQAFESATEFELEISFFALPSREPYSLNSWAKTKLHYTREALEAASNAPVRIGGTAFYSLERCTWQPIDLMASAVHSEPHWNSTFGPSKALDDLDWNERPATKLLMEHLASLNGED